VNFGLLGAVVTKITVTPCSLDVLYQSVMQVGACIFRQATWKRR